MCEQSRVGVCLFVCLCVCVCVCVVEREGERNLRGKIKVLEPGIEPGTLGW